MSAYQCQGCGQTFDWYTDSPVTGAVEIKTIATDSVAVRTA